MNWNLFKIAWNIKNLISFEKSLENPVWAIIHERGGETVHLVPVPVIYTIAGLVPIALPNPVKIRPISNSIILEEFAIKAHPRTHL